MLTDIYDMAKKSDNWYKQLVHSLLREYAPTGKFLQIWHTEIEFGSNFK